MPVAISAEGLGKRYRISHQLNPYGRLAESAMGALRAPIDLLRGRKREATEWLWALRDVTFEVQQGDVVGVIGRNGDGKTTLLKLLARITEPTSGRAVMHGRVASLLEVGTGFHLELTGRENIFLSGAILGMRRAEIARKFDEIVDFAGTEQFLDTPVKRYSTGMRVRLGFAVAAHLETDILLVDEVLAVGDGAFQKKCIAKMSDVAAGGRTVMFVSHNMQAVASLCNRAMLLWEGRVAFAGPTAETIDAYVGSWTQQIDEGDGSMVYPDQGDGDARLTAIRLLDPRGRPALRHNVLEPMDIEIEFVVRRWFPTLLIACEVWSRDGTPAFATQQSDWPNYAGPEKSTAFPMAPGRYRATVHIPAPLLNAGPYELEIYLTTGPFREDTQRRIAVELVDDDSFLSYVTKSPRGGIVAPAIPWDVVRIDDESAIAVSGERRAGR
jgi:lipopolysaccharide transport system ATP-binding protein